MLLKQRNLEEDEINVKIKVLCIVYNKKAFILHNLRTLLNGSQYIKLNLWKKTKG